MAILTTPDLPSAFPAECASHVEAVAKNLSLMSGGSLGLPYYEEVLVNGETLRIFDRLYLNNPSPLFPSEIDNTITNCLYTRNPNGYVRQQHMERLINTNHPDIAIPFVIRLLADYVLDVLLTIEPFILSHQNLVIMFLKHNPQFWRTQKSRVISYWNEYYRSTYHYGGIYKPTYDQLASNTPYYDTLQDYPTWQLVLQIDALLNENNG